MSTEQKRDVESIGLEMVQSLDKGKRNDQAGYHDISDDYPADQKKKMLLQMDLRIIPVLWILYRKCLDSLTLSFHAFTWPYEC